MIPTSSSHGRQPCVSATAIQPQPPATERQCQAISFNSLRKCLDAPVVSLLATGRHVCLGAQVLFVADPVQLQYRESSHGDSWGMEDLRCEEEVDWQGSIGVCV